MFNTINSSPMLLTKSVFKWIFVLSNYQTCTFPLQSTLYLSNAILFEQVWKKKIHNLFSYFYPNVFDSLMFFSGFKVLYRIGKKTKYNSLSEPFCPKYFSLKWSHIQETASENRSWIQLFKKKVFTCLKLCMVFHSCLTQRI